MAAQASESYEEYRFLDVRIERDLATVRFDPGADHGDFEHSFFTDIRDVFVPLSRDARVRAVVLAVEPPTRSTGRFAQLITEASLEQRAGRFLTIQQVFTAVTMFRKPVVAGVIGKASGIIAVLPLLCDSVVAGVSARFGDSHVGIGIAAGDGGTPLWPALVGPGLAKQILLEGRELSADEALGHGFVSRVVSDEEVVATAMEMAERLGRLPRVAYMSTKLAINNHLRLAALISGDLTAAYEAATVVEEPFVSGHAGALAGRATSEE